jgi:hypothetical protein
LLLCSSYLLLGFPTGRSSKSTPHRNLKVKYTAARRRAAGIPDPIQNRSTSANSAGSERPEEVIIHRMCMSTRRCCYCGAGSLCRYCHTGVVASRSSRP